MTCTAAPGASLARTVTYALVGFTLTAACSSGAAGETRLDRAAQLTSNTAVTQQLVDLCELYDILFDSDLTEQEKKRTLGQRFDLSLSRAEIDNYVFGRGGTVEIPDDPRGRSLTTARASLYVCREHSRAFDDRFSQPVD